MKPSIAIVSFFLVSGCRTVNHNSSVERADRKPSSIQISWPYYAGDSGATKFSYADLINRSNVANLKLAWHWESIDNPLSKAKGLLTNYNETTPIMIDGQIYFSTAFNQVVSLDPSTGQQNWVFDPKVYELGYPVGLGFIQRGVAYWSNDETGQTSKKRVFVATSSDMLLSIDAQSGSLDEKFGQRGMVDLKIGLSRPADMHSNYTQTSPPLICGKTIIVGSAENDFISKFSNPRGDVRGFDLETGELKWTFHTVPQDNEFGVQTWKNESWKYVGNTNVWAPMSADLEEKLVYLPVSTPENDFYGGERKGNGLFGDSIVSLNCDSGVRRWHYQLIHHGLWDYDPPAPPILFDVKTKDKTIKILAQVTKQAFVYVFDRVTGQPIWPIYEKSAPTTDVVGEEVSPTQPFPSKPAPFDRQGVREEELIDFTPELRAQALQIVKQYRYGELYTPPSLKGTISLPGVIGGASWAGAAYSPVTQSLYVPSITRPYVTVLEKSAKAADTAYTRNLFKTGIDGPQGLPLFKPPYGRITAIDMKSGEHVWMKPIGKGPRDNSALGGVSLPSEDLGWARRIHVLATPTLIFAAQEGVNEVGGIENNGVTLMYKIANDDAYLMALDPITGETLAKIKMDLGNAYGAPMTYVYRGKQYIVIPYGGANLPSGFMAFSN